MDSNSTHNKIKLRALPSIDRLLLGFGDAVEQFGHREVTGALREVIQERRKQISAGHSPGTDEISITEDARQILLNRASPGLRRVFNLTGGVAEWAREVDPTMPTY